MGYVLFLPSLWAFFYSKFRDLSFYQFIKPWCCCFLYKLYHIFFFWLVCSVCIFLYTVVYPLVNGFLIHCSHSSRFSDEFMFPESKGKICRQQNAQQFGMPNFTDRNGVYMNKSIIAYRFILRTTMWLIYHIYCTKKWQQMVFTH